MEHGAVIRHQDEVVVGGMAKGASLSERSAPSLTETLMGKRAHKSNMKQKKAGDNKSGSVFEPEEHGSGVYGGRLENEEKGHRRLGTILGFAVPIGMGAAYLALQRARAKRSEHEPAA